MERYKDILGKSEAELDTLIEESRDMLRTARFENATKEVKDTRLKRNTRRYLARLLTAKNANKH